jgi:hypothetical protein
VQIPVDRNISCPIERQTMAVTELSTSDDAILPLNSPSFKHQLKESVFSFEERVGDFALPAKDFALCQGDFLFKPSTPSQSRTR